MKIFALLFILLVNIPNNISDIDIDKDNNINNSSVTKTLHTNIFNLPIENLFDSKWFLTESNNTSSKALQKTLFFDADGQVTIVNKDQNGEFDVIKRNWVLADYSDIAYLVLSDATGASTRYAIQTKGDGMIVADVATNQQFDIVSVEHLDSKKATLFGKQMAGTWEAVAKGMLFQAHFSDNGGYYISSQMSLVQTKGSLEINELGTWSISQDGQFLIMTTQQNGGIASRYVVSIDVLTSPKMDLVFGTQKLHFKKTSPIRA
ncbi:MAG: hypothetical protein KA974_05555 [Saprospiraceae bacterium]|nr:hypothetical protein [Saprospiraceae bacterium]MBP7699404.1 hypothetical protein [Saprospiraceae bacterium]